MGGFCFDDDLAEGYFLVCIGLNIVSRSGRPLSRPPRKRFASAVHLLAGGMQQDICDKEAEIFV